MDSETESENELILDSYSIKKKKETAKLKLVEDDIRTISRLKVINLIDIRNSNYLKY